MKSRVNFSNYSAIITLFVIGVFVVLLDVCHDETRIFAVPAAAISILLVLASVYAPLSVSADEKRITVRSLLKRHSVPMRRVVSADPFQPTIGSRRIFGSGGFMGYWGIFKEGDVGTYTAYYGKASDCFIIRLDNGDKYVIGCKSPEAMVDYIRSQIGK